MNQLQQTVFEKQLNNQAGQILSLQLQVLTLIEQKNMIQSELDLLKSEQIKSKSSPMELVK